MSDQVSIVHCARKSSAKKVLSAEGAAVSSLDAR